MLALTFQCPVSTYLTCKTLAPIWRGVYTSRLAPARLREINRPRELPPGWARVRVIQCGLCSSDLHLATLDLHPSVAPAAVFNDPQATSVLGHELVGVIEEVSGPSSLAAGQRVISRSGAFRNCFNAGHADNPCPGCASGEYNYCIRQGELTAALEPIRHGGFASHYIDHVANLIPVTDSMSDDDAALIEPLACSLRAVLRAGVSGKGREIASDVRSPLEISRPSSRVLVIGGGIQGLGATHWLHALAPNAQITAIARHPYQSDLARRLGASNVLTDRASFDDFAKLLNTTVARGPVGHNEMLVDGFDVVIDSIGTPQTLQRSLRLTRPGGRVVILGAHLAPGNLDFTPIWFREVEVTGVYAHGRECFDGRSIGTLSLTMDLLAQHPLPVPFVTHRLPLTRYAEAIRIAQHKSQTHSIRVMLTPT
jgi:threonine dehydrogenase-like Zn-dependent dehydrogenase